jgi:hypothetical protein
VIGIAGADDDSREGVFERTDAASEIARSLTADERPDIAWVRVSNSSTISLGVLDFILPRFEMIQDDM